MPGRTPSEAVASFLEPLREALKVLDAVTKLSVAPKGGFRTGTRYAWVLNGASGVLLGPAGNFFAGMEFEIVDCDPTTNEYGHPFRVSTRSYHYKLRSPQGSDAWRMHWHPEGNSPVEHPHLHLPPDLKRHLLSERATLEQAISWCAEYGAPLTCSRDEAADRLVLAESAHRLHRTWGPIIPPPRRYRRSP
jgi:hypothetical protein